MAGAKVLIQYVAAAVGGRDNMPVSAPYRPHFRVGTGEYLGVELANDSGTHTGAGAIFTATARFVYDGVPYEQLKPGVQFQVLEGPHIVGIGVVEELIP